MEEAKTIHFIREGFDLENVPSWFSQEGGKVWARSVEKVRAVVQKTKSAHFGAPSNGNSKKKQIPTKEITGYLWIVDRGNDTDSCRRLPRLNHLALFVVDPSAAHPNDFSSYQLVGSGQRATAEDNKEYLEKLKNIFKSDSEGVQTTCFRRLPLETERDFHAQIEKNDGGLDLTFYQEHASPNGGEKLYQVSCFFGQTLCHALYREVTQFEIVPEDNLSDSTSNKNIEKTKDDNISKKISDNENYNNRFELPDNSRIENAAKPDGLDEVKDESPQFSGSIITTKAIAISLFALVALAACSWGAHRLFSAEKL